MSSYRKVLDTGALGNLLAVHAEGGDRMARTGVAQRFHDEVSLSGGGILMDLGCHATDLAFWLTGASSATTLRATGRIYGDVDREVNLAVQLDSPGRDQVTLEMTLSWLAKRRGTLALRFSNGAAVASAQPSGEVELMTLKGDPIAAMVAPRGEQSAAGSVHQACYLVWRSFPDALMEREPASFTLESVRPTVATVESAYRILRSGGC